MNETTKILLNYGVLGVCVVALAYYIKYLHGLWKEDRDANRMALKEMTEHSREAITNNTSVLSGLKTLLETTRRK